MGSWRKQEKAYQTKLKELTVTGYTETWFQLGTSTHLTKREDKVPIWHKLVYTFSRTHIKHKIEKISIRSILLQSHSSLPMNHEHTSTSMDQHELHETELVFYSQPNLCVYPGPGSRTNSR